MIKNSSKHYKSGAREIIANVIKVCDEEANINAMKLPVISKTQRAAMYAGVSVSTIKRIRVEDKKRCAENPGGVLSSPGRTKKQRLKKTQKVSATHKRKSNGSPEVGESAWSDDCGASQESDPFQDTCFTFEEVNIKPEIGDYEIFPPINRPHFPVSETFVEKEIQSKNKKHVELTTKVPTTSFDDPAQLGPKTSKNNQFGAYDKVANAMQAFVGSLKRNFYLETSINGFGTYVTSVLKKFPNVERQKAKREIMAVLDKYQQLLDLSTTPNRKSDGSTNYEKSDWLDSSAVSQESEPFDDDVIPAPKRPLSPVFEKVRKEEILTRIKKEKEEAVELITTDNAQQVEPKTNQINVDDKIANAMGNFVESLRNFYPETSTDAFGNYVTSILKEIPQAERHKARQEITAVLAKYQELLDTEYKRKSDVKKEVEIGDYEIIPPLKRSHAVKEEDLEMKIKTEYEDPFELVTAVPTTSCELVQVAKRQKISKDNQNSVDDEVIDAIEVFMDSLRSFYPQTSIDAFGNYVASVLKEFSKVERYKASQEIMAILEKYQLLLNMLIL